MGVRIARLYGCEPHSDAYAALTFHLGCAKSEPRGSQSTIPICCLVVIWEYGRLQTVVQRGDSLTGAPLLRASMLARLIEAILWLVLPHRCMAKNIKGYLFASLFWCGLHNNSGFEPRRPQRVHPSHPGFSIVLLEGSWTTYLVGYDVYETEESQVAWHTTLCGERTLLFSISAFGTLSR